MVERKEKGNVIKGAEQREPRELCEMCLLVRVENMGKDSHGDLGLVVCIRLHEAG